MTTALATSAAGAIASSCIAVTGGAVSTKSNNNVAMSFGNSHFFSSSILSLQSSSAVVNMQRPARRTNLVVCGKVSEVPEALMSQYAPESCNSLCLPYRAG
jgi:TctA family transporter